MVSYELELKQAKSALSRGRNSFRAISPINALPDDILRQIFETICRSDACPIQYEYDVLPMIRGGPKTLMTPDIISHVCTRWRQVALGIPSLWAHIDLMTPSHLSFNKLLKRAVVFADRVGSKELTVHIDVSDETPFGASSVEELGQFYSLVGPKTRCIEWKSSSTRSTSNELLERGLLYATPGTLRELIIKDSIRNAGAFIFPINDPSGLSTNTENLSFRLQIPEYFLNDILRPITFLELGGTFFPWRSPAYSGLTDLRLLIRTSLAGSTAISRWELAQIFMASPTLRSFHFNLPIKRDTLSDISPVPLNELEELYITRMDVAHYGQLFSVLSPGSRPLKLAISTNFEGFPASGPAFSPSVVNFFRRSNFTVSELYLTRDEMVDLPAPEPSLARILTWLPIGPLGLHLLGLNGLPVVRPDNGFANALPSWPSIGTLYLEHSYVEKAPLRELAVVCPIQTLILGNVYIDREDFGPHIEDDFWGHRNIFSSFERVGCGFKSEAWAFDYC